MSDLVERLRFQTRYVYGIVTVTMNEAADELERLQAERDALARALHEIAEEWAGAECGEPVHAQEAYAIALAKRMYTIAVEARKT